MTCYWSDAHFSFVKNHLTYQNLCSLSQIIFFLNLVWSVYQYVYDEPTYIHTHFKKFGPGRTLTVSKYTTKISIP